MNAMNDSEKCTLQRLRCYGGPLDGEIRPLKYGTSLIEPGPYKGTERMPGTVYLKKEFCRSEYGTERIIISVLIASTEEDASFTYRILYEDWDKHDDTAVRFVPRYTPS